IGKTSVAGTIAGSSRAGGGGDVPRRAGHTTGTTARRVDGRVRATGRRGPRTPETPDVTAARGIGIVAVRREQERRDIIREAPAANRSGGGGGGVGAIAARV